MKRDTAQRHSLKIMAIFFAVSVWFYVLNSEPVQTEKKLIINYILPKGFSMANQSVKEVTLKLKGSKAFIQNVFNNKEKFTIDLNPYFISSGRTFRVKFYPSDIVLPFGVEIIEMIPKETLIELDRMVSMKVPIKVLYIGNVPIGRKLKELLVEPDVLNISGPIEILEHLTKLETIPVNQQVFNKDEGVISVLLPDLDSRLKFEQGQIIKIKFKTQKIVKRIKD